MRALILAAIVLTTGCMRVKPYQRQTLARPDMVVGGDSEIRGGEAHAGGCGCN